MPNKKITDLDAASVINNDAVFPFSQKVNGDDETLKTSISILKEKILGKEISGTLTSGSTSITLSDASITTSSTIDVYTDGDVEYNSISISTGSVTLTFDAQGGNLGVKVRVS